MDIEPIGYFKGESIYKSDAPRQSLFAANAGKIILLPHKNFEQALDDIEGFERIWVIFLFHHNSNWKPKTTPPVAPDSRKIGLFATRSPYRPNPIGLSCVQLLKRDGLVLEIGKSDILDGTPILDIKPYIPEIDSFPDSKAGWRDFEPTGEFQISFEKKALEKASFLEENSEIRIENFSRIQLVRDPVSNNRKRVTHIGDNLYSIGYRTWKIIYSCDQDSKICNIKDVISNYTQAELDDFENDKYFDKNLHRLFNSKFNSGDKK